MYKIKRTPENVRASFHPPSRHPSPPLKPASISYYLSFFTDTALFILSEIFMGISSSASHRWGSCVCLEMWCQPSPWLDTRPVPWHSVRQELWYPECWALTYCHFTSFHPWIALRHEITPSQPLSFMQQFPVSKSIGGKERVAVSHGIWQVGIEAQHTPLSKKMWYLAWNKHLFLLFLR